MELRIINPSEETGFLSEIQWNYEEVKAWVASRVEEYKNIAYTEDAVKDMKQDRAELNKAKTAIENERKRIKKLCMEPYERFERQVKEVTGLIDEPIGLIDGQLKEIEEKEKTAEAERHRGAFQNHRLSGFYCIGKNHGSEMAECNGISWQD